MRSRLLIPVALAVLLAGCGAPSADSSAPPEPQPASTGLTPTLEQAKKDTGDLYARGCSSSYKDAELHPCVFVHSATSRSPVVVAVGDSKVAQWVPALQVIAEKNSWKLVTMTKSGCAFSDARRALQKAEYPSCDTWNRAASAEVTRLAPDLLFTTQFDYQATFEGRKILRGTENREQMIRGLSARILAVERAGTPVATIAETPLLPFEAPACLLENPDDPTACEEPRAEALKDAGVVAEAAQRSDAAFVDLTEHFCGPDSCPPIQGEMLVYRDDHHLTATYARSLAPSLESALTEALTSDLATRLLGAGR